MRYWQLAKCGMAEAGNFELYFTRRSPAAASTASAAHNAASAIFCMHFLLELVTDYRRIVQIAKNVDSSLGGSDPCALRARAADGCNES